MQLSSRFALLLLVAAPAFAQTPRPLPFSPPASDGDLTLPPDDSPILPDDEPTPPPVPAGPTVPFGGQVLRMGDRLPLAGINVILDDGTVIPPALTDAEGRFGWPAVPVGAHKVHLRGGSVFNGDVDEKLNENKKLDVTYYVRAKEKYSTTVRGTPVVRETVETSLSQDELKRIPGTQGDTLKAVQNLAGVARAPFGGGQLVVWGSAPGDTRAYVDGVSIPTLYHFGGLRATVNSEMVSGLTFLPGGFGVEYGRGLGGVVAIDSRRPREKGWHGYVQTDLIDASLSLEGAITKNLSFAIAARKSVIEVFLPLLTTNDFQISPSYWDYQARLSWRVTSRDELSLFLFGSDDTINLLARNPDPALAAAINSRTYYHRGLVSYLHRFPELKGATLAITASLGYDSPFTLHLGFGTAKIDINAINVPYNLRAVARLPIHRFMRLDVGVDFEGTNTVISISSTGLEQFTSGGGAFRADGLNVFRHAIAPFLALTFKLWNDRLTITPQLRLEMYSFTGYRGTADQFETFYFRPEPRVTARLQVTDWMAFRGAVGLYHQLPPAAAFLKSFGNPNVVPEQAIHYVFGVEFKPTQTLSIELDGFYKDLSQLIVSRVRADDPPQINEGVGRVVGGQLLVRQQLWKGLFGWVAYTLSRSERREHPGELWHVFSFDQTHILTLVMSYKLPRGFQIGARFRYVTGNPIQNGNIRAVYDDLNSDNYVPIYGTPYSTRLADFHQLDLRFDKEWTFRWWKMSIYLDIQNVYNAQPPEAVTYNFDFSQSRTISGLPFLPAFGVRGDF